MSKAWILIGVLLFLHLLAKGIGQSDIFMQRVPRGFMLLPSTLPPQSNPIVGAGAIGRTPY